MSAFSDYAQRIDVATTQLEADVASVSAFSGDLTTAVTRAETAASAAESELTAILEAKPLFKGEYGSVQEYTTRIVINTQAQVESFFGTLFKAKAGCTGISLDVIPQTDLDAFHCYVRNVSGVAISVTSSVGVVDTPVITNGSFVRVTLNAAKNGWEVVSYTTEGSVSGGGGGDFDWTTIPEATQQLKGLMSAEDKTKLDGVSTSVATTTEDGLMSSVDKVKLDGIEAQAQKNVNADFNATVGDALILNKPTVAYEGDQSFNPVTEQYVYDDNTARDGYFTYQEKRQLIDLGSRTLVDEAPADGQQYARQNGGWSVVAGGGGGASFPTYEDIITRGKGPYWSPVTEVTEYARHVLIQNDTHWESIKTPAGLLKAVYGTSNIEEIPYELGPVPVVFRNTYSGSATDKPQLAPFALSSYSFCLVEVRPHASFKPEQGRPVNLAGGNVWCKVTFISNNSSDIRNNDPVAANAPAFTRTIQPREYVNNTYSGVISGTTPETAVVQWPFAWSEMVYTTVTGAPT
jgi:hypothetical protein